MEAFDTFMFSYTACSNNLEIASVNSEVTAYDTASVSIDLTQGLHTVTMIRTQGSDGNWIQSYTVYFSQNKVDWALYREEGVPRVSV